ncbi:MAG TPA: 4Fe-4S dicluster domain-containing protein [Longimicrobiales bacterium]|nr:4Fe-4S dicluster domain-containing protein [Longimicrobiales bacterium]
MLASKLREALICLRAGRVTLPYPFEPHDPAPGFRGKIVVDPDLCFGCGGCANACPAGVILIQDTAQFTRRLEFQWARCTYCGRCAEVCPEGAILMSQQYETATDSALDMVLALEVFMGPCQRCGRCFPPANPQERLSVHGFRLDDVTIRPGALAPEPPPLAVGAGGNGGHP